MRWKPKPKPLPKLPEIGDRRTRVVFAWWPVEMHDGMKVWLERYNEESEYVKRGRYYLTAEFWTPGWIITKRSIIVQCRY